MRDRVVLTLPLRPEPGKLISMPYRAFPLARSSLLRSGRAHAPCRQRPRACSAWVAFNIGFGKRSKVNVIRHSHVSSHVLEHVRPFEVYSE